MYLDPNSDDRCVFNYDVGSDKNCWDTFDSVVGCINRRKLQNSGMTYLKIAKFWNSVIQNDPVK